MYNNDLKMLRLEKNMSQEVLANKIGIAKQTIYKYEKGIIKNIPYNKILKLSEALGVSPSYILGWEEENTKINNINKNTRNNEEINLINKYQSLDSHGKKIINHILNDEYERCKQNIVKND